MDGYKNFEYELSFIGIHFLYGAVNAGKLIEVLWLRTSYERASMIFSAKFDYRQINMNGKKASGTISYKVFLSPELVKYYFLLHAFLVRIGVSITMIKVHDNIRKIEAPKALYWSCRWRKNYMELGSYRDIESISESELFENCAQVDDIPN